MSALCPVSGTSGIPVGLVTLRSLVRSEELSTVGDGQSWFFCGEPNCQVVYFSIDQLTIAKEAVSIRVAEKESAPPHPVCYCFGHTVESIGQEVAETGESSVVASITARVKAGECHCETANPKGSCCLGEVSRVVRSTIGEEDPGITRRRPGLRAAAVSVVTAALASACCWLPLLLVAFGTSAAGVSAELGAWRPLFLLVSAISLSTGFYLAYFRKVQCTAAGECSAQSARSRRLNRVTLWVAAVFVAGFALFPNYASSLVAVPAAQTPVSGPTESVVVDISGMTCEACAVRVQSELLKVPGVLRASVSYEDQSAVVEMDLATPESSHASLVIAVEQAGFAAVLEQNPKGDER